GGGGWSRGPGRLAQVEQRFARVAGADLARVDQPLAVVAVVADQERAQAHPRALRVGESADDELLAADALDLHPPRPAARDVGAVQLLADDALAPRAPAGGTSPARLPGVTWGRPPRSALRPAGRSFSSEARWGCQRCVVSYGPTWRVAGAPAQVRKEVPPPPWGRAWSPPQ